MILVTGGTGLVGSHLIYDLVKQGYHVRAFIRDKEKIEKVRKVFSYYSDEYEELINKVDWFLGNLHDIYTLNEAFQNVSMVYHCAAIVAIDGRDKAELIQKNIAYTEHIVNLCLEHGVEKLCHVSSIAALGGSVNGELITEDSKWISSKRHSAYAISKFKSEMEVWRGIQGGLKAVIVNPSVILGPGFWNSGSGSLFSKAAKGMKYYTEGSTGFVDVRDVSNSMIRLMESEITSERFIINSENLTYKDLFELIADSIGKERPKKNATKGLLKTAMVLDSIASITGLKQKEITKDVIRAGLSNSYYSNEKIRKELKNDFIPIKESIKDIVEKFNKELTAN